MIHKLNLKRVILFGSDASGNPTPDSDVDLLVIVEPKEGETWRERVVAVVSLALYPRPFPVDILVKTPQELEEAWPHNFFLREIVRKDVVLYEHG